MKKTSKEIIRSINLRPDKMKVKLNYYYGYNGTNVSTTPVFFQFSGNSPWDPDYGGTGTSVNMWTTLSGYYNKYMCTYSKIRFTWQCATAGTFTMQFWSLIRSLNQTQPTSVISLMAQPYARYKQLQALTGQTSNTNHTVKYKMSTPKMLGRKMDPSLDRVAVSANPTEQYIYEFACVSSVAAQFNIICRMTYWVEFSDRATVFHINKLKQTLFSSCFSESIWWTLGGGTEPQRRLGPKIV